MKLLAWNLNHRAVRRRIPDCVASAIVAHVPDIAIFSEYVEGPDHERFITALADGGMRHVLLSPRTEGHNQILIASNKALRRGRLRAPDIHPAVPSNVLEAVVESIELHVIGFRMPAFKTPNRSLKRKTWNWLLAELDQRVSGPLVIAGDFNTAPNDPPARCGDCFMALSQSGWQSGTPISGYSWRHPKTGSEWKIDHLFLSPSLAFVSSEYRWGFKASSPDAQAKKVGVPDHAMLVGEFLIRNDWVNA